MKILAYGAGRKRGRVESGAGRKRGRQKAVEGRRTKGKNVTGFKSNLDKGVAKNVI